MSNQKSYHQTHPGGILTAANKLATLNRLGNGPDYPPPEAVILCYQPWLGKLAVKKWRGKRARGFFGEFFLLRGAKRPIGVAYNFGIGAPVVGVLVEDFAAFGVRKVIGIGEAGGLQPDLTTGELILADRAVRNEGVSDHYLPPGDTAAADDHLLGQWQKILGNTNTKYRVGISWTTSAPYRETAAEVERLQRKGVLVVEMEAAALYAVAGVLGIEAGAGFAVSDSLADGRWRPASEPERVKDGLRRLLTSCVAALEELG